MEENKVKKLPIVIALASVLAMTGCDTGGASTSSGETPDINDSTAVTDLASAATYLNDVHNYTAYYQLYDRNGGLGIYYNNYYTNNYVYSDRLGQEWGYVSSEEGIYPLTMKTDSEGGETLVGGELIAGETSLYGGDLFSSVADLDASWFTPGEKEMSVTNKAARLTILDMMGMDPSQIVSIEDLTVEVGDTLSTFTITLTFTYQVWEMTIENIGITTSETVEAFLADGGSAFVVPTDLDFSRLLFAEMNYTRDVINYSTLQSDGYEYFLPTYFYGDYTGESQIFSQGMMAFNHVSYLGNDLYGSYLFYLQNGAVTMVAAGVGSGGNPIYRPYNSSPTIYDESNYNYPCNMELWNHLEEFEEVDEGIYELYNEELILDFADNNGVDLASIGATSHRLRMEIENADNQNETRITFTMYYGLSGAENNTAIYPYFDFGTSEIAAVETFLDTNNLRQFTSLKNRPHSDPVWFFLCKKAIFLSLLYLPSLLIQRKYF